MTSTREAIVAESSNDRVLAARTTPEPRAVVPSQSISASRTIGALGHHLDARLELALLGRLGCLLLHDPLERLDRDLDLVVARLARRGAAATVPVRAAS